MSTRRSRGGRRSSLGLHSADRLRGGFLASRLPAGRGGTSQSLSLEQTNDQGSSTGSSTQSSTFRSHDDTSDSDGSSGGSGSLIGICRSIQEQLGSVARRIVVVEQQQKQLSNAVKELAAILKQQEKASFSIKDSPLEQVLLQPALRAEAARLFCSSLTRDPLPSEINAAIGSVMGSMGAKDTYKIEAALKYVKGKLTDYRSEERRKAMHLVRNHCYMTTRELARRMMKHMHAAEEVDEDQYIKHLAMFRKFVRDCQNESEVNYASFRGWLHGSVMDEEQWDAVIEEDESFDYSTLGVGLRAPVPESESEVQVYTSSSVGDDGHSGENAPEYDYAED